jgi:hypothetical protein
MIQRLTQHVRDPQGAIASALFVVVGFGAFLTAKDYDFGTLSMIGPGFFPVVLSLLLVLFGVLGLFKSLRVEGPPASGPIRIRPLLMITIGILGFGLMARPLGFAAAVSFCVIVSSLGSSRFNLVRTLATAAVMTVLCSTLFIWGLGMPYRIIPVLGW